jgi:hypothetical protein
MPESAGSYVSENKYLISLYIFRYLFASLAEKIVSRKSFFFNRLEFLAYDPALSGIRPLLVFLTDGRVEMDTNPVENTIRPITLNRKNALFAGHDEGGRTWARMASLIETCKLNAVDPYAYLRATLTAIANKHPKSRIDDLMPWAFQKTSS